MGSGGKADADIHGPNNQRICSGENRSSIERFAAGACGLESGVEVGRGKEGFEASLGSVSEPVEEIRLEEVGFAPCAEIFMGVKYRKVEFEEAIFDGDEKCIGQFVHAGVGAVPFGPSAKWRNVISIETEDGLASFVKNGALFEPHVAFVNSGDAVILGDCDADGEGIVVGDFESKFFESGAKVEVIEKSSVDVEQAGVDEGDHKIALEVEDPGDFVAETGTPEERNHVNDAYREKNPEHGTDIDAFVLTGQEVIFNAAADPPVAGGTDW